MYEADDDGVYHINVLCILYLYAHTHFDCNIFSCWICFDFHRLKQAARSCVLVHLFLDTGRRRTKEIPMQMMRMAATRPRVRARSAQMILFSCSWRFIVVVAGHVYSENWSEEEQSSSNKYICICVVHEYSHLRVDRLFLINYALLYEHQQILNTYYSCWFKKELESRAIFLHRQSFQCTTTSGGR